MPPRLRVVAPALLIALAISATCAVPFVGNAFASGAWLRAIGGAFCIVFLPLAGPLADLLHHKPQVHYLAPLLALAIAAHPLRPNRWTGVVSGVGVVAWLLIGLVCVYSFAT